MLQVTDVMARYHPVVVGHADRALQLGPDREHGAAGDERQPQRFRSESARPPQRAHPATCGTDHGIVATDVNGAIVREDPVDERRQPRGGVVVLVGDRLVAGVAARHHERAADPGEDEVVERAVGQHHAQLR